MPSIALILLSLLFLFLVYWLVRFALQHKRLKPQAASREKLLQLVREINEGAWLNEHERKFLKSILNFKDRIVREVMVPRVDLFCLPEDTTIREAAFAMQNEGYSRVPVYKHTQDHIVGVVMYKDILAKYMEHEARSEEADSLNAPIETLVKKVLYAPETKKISMLLQEFRKKQMHMAVVVDEYGITAGVVTIEDILEEIVGEIADEYDQAQVLVMPAGRGQWIVDGRMNLLDLAEETGIKVPQEGEYDTMAGYVFFRLGTIPKKGVVLHHDEFDIEILSSDDRLVQKVKIIPQRQAS